MEEFAIIEQMGHRRFGARIREVEFCGVKLLEATTLTEPPLTQRIHPQSLYALTGCTEAQARSACGRWSLPADLAGMLPAPAEKPPREDDLDFDDHEPDPGKLGQQAIELHVDESFTAEQLSTAALLLADLLSDEHDRPAFPHAFALVQALRTSTKALLDAEEGF